MAYPSKTYTIDFENMCLSNQIDGQEACLQFIAKTLSTDKYSWRFYDQYFGVDFDGLLGKSKGYIMAQFPKRIEECLLCDDRIVSISDYTYEDIDEETLEVTFLITTIYSPIRYRKTLKIG